MAAVEISLPSGTVLQLQPSIVITNGVASSASGEDGLRNGPLLPAYLTVGETAVCRRVPGQTALPWEPLLTAIRSEACQVVGLKCISSRPPIIPGIGRLYASTVGPVSLPTHALIIGPFAAAFTDMCTCASSLLPPYCFSRPTAWVVLAETDYVPCLTPRAAAPPPLPSPAPPLPTLTSRGADKCTTSSPAGSSSASAGAAINFSIDRSSESYPNTYAAAGKTPAGIAGRAYVPTTTTATATATTTANPASIIHSSSSSSSSSSMRRPGPTVTIVRRPTPATPTTTPTTTSSSNHTGRRPDTTTTIHPTPTTTTLNRERQEHKGDVGSPQQRGEGPTTTCSNDPPTTALGLPPPLPPRRAVSPDSDVGTHTHIHTGAHNNAHSTAGAPERHTEGHNESGFKWCRPEVEEMLVRIRQRYGPHPLNGVGEVILKKKSVCTRKGCGGSATGCRFKHAGHPNWFPPFCRWVVGCRAHPPKRGFAPCNRFHADEMDELRHHLAPEVYLEAEAVVLDYYKILQQRKSGGHLTPHPMQMMHGLNQLATHQTHGFVAPHTTHAHPSTAPHTTHTPSGALVVVKLCSSDVVDTQDHNPPPPSVAPLPPPPPPSDEQPPPPPPPPPPEEEIPPPPPPPPSSDDQVLSPLYQWESPPPPSPTPPPPSSDEHVPPPIPQVESSSSSSPPPPPSSSKQQIPSPLYPCESSPPPPPPPISPPPPPPADDAKWEVDSLMSLSDEDNESGAHTHAHDCDGRDSVCLTHGERMGDVGRGCGGEARHTGVRGRGVKRGREGGCERDDPLLQLREKKLMAPHEGAYGDVHRDLRVGVHTHRDVRPDAHTQDGTDGHRGVYDERQPPPLDMHTHVHAPLDIHTHRDVRADRHAHESHMHAHTHTHDTARHLAPPPDVHPLYDDLPPPPSPPRSTASHGDGYHHHHHDHHQQQHQHHLHRRPHTHAAAAGAAPFDNHTSSRSPLHGTHTRPRRHFSPQQGVPPRTHPRVQVHTHAEGGGGMDGYMQTEEGARRSGRMGASIGDGGRVGMYVHREGGGAMGVPMRRGMCGGVLDDRFDRGPPLDAEPRFHVDRRHPLPPHMDTRIDARTPPLPFTNGPLTAHRGPPYPPDTIDARSVAYGGVDVGRGGRRGGGGGGRSRGVERPPMRHMDAGPPPPPPLHMDMPLLHHRGPPPSPHHTGPRSPRMRDGVYVGGRGINGGGGGGGRGRGRGNRKGFGEVYVPQTQPHTHAYPDAHGWDTNTLGGQETGWERRKRPRWVGRCEVLCPGIEGELGSLRVAELDRMMAEGPLAPRLSAGTCSKSGPARRDPCACHLLHLGAPGYFPAICRFDKSCSKRKDACCMFWHADQLECAGLSPQALAEARLAAADWAERVERDLTQCVRWKVGQPWVES